MHKWREVKLGDVVDVIMGQSPKSETYNQDNVGLPFYQGVVDFSNRFVTPRVYCSDPIKIIESGDILLSVRAPVGRVNFTKEKCSIGRGNSGLRHKEGLQNFLFYVLMNFANKLERSSSGSVFSSISKSDIENFKFYCPPFPEQKAIAEVLSSLDDKIDLLHRQNKTLEDMAQALFRKWFVENPEREGWEKVKLGDFISCSNGISYRSADLNPSNKALVTLKSFNREGGFSLNGFKEYTGKYKEQHIVKQGDLIVAHTDITQDANVIGNPALVISDPKYRVLMASLDAVKVQPLNDWMTTEFLYFLMRTRDFKQHCLSLSNGSTVLHLRRDAVPSFEFLLPPTDKINQFALTSKQITSKIFENVSQTRILEHLRNTLLPRLMSGEVRVKNC